MAASMATVSFPVEAEYVPLSNKDDKVCVVSILGKSSYRTFSSKATVFNPMLDADIFKGVKDCLKDQINQGLIECYYDIDTNVIYLHHTCLQDTYRLTAVLRTLDDAPNKDFQNLWQKEECHYAKGLLLLFQLSHMIVISHPGSTFDVTYVRLFRIIDSIRLKIQKSLSDQLYEFPISKDWKFNGRPCSPRVLFMFEMSTIEYDPDEIIETTGYRSRPQKPIKRLQHSMEDQIYKILRKSRVITNISNNSLFAVPANQEFVFLQVQQNEVTDPVAFYLQQIKDNCTIKETESDSPRSKSYQTSRRTQAAGSTERSRSHMLSNNGGEYSFKEFLMQHIDTALTKGFDDNVGRHPVSATFELPTSETWFALATKLYHYFFSDKLDSKIQPHFNTLKSLMETDLRFSENRCNKVLPVAESAYQENLPAHYITNYHISKLSQAKKVFSQFARGPACDKYMKQLEESCERFWKAGRQLCEEVSLTGNHCVNPLHRAEDQPETDSNSHLPIMQHSSQLKMKAACNCGRQQADKDDPFDHKAANYDFYQNLANSCCDTLEHFDFPVFEPSTGDIRAAALALNSSPKVKVNPVKLTQKESSKGESGSVTMGTTSLSLALSLGQSEGGGSDLYGHGGQSNLTPLHDDDQDAASNHDQSEAQTPSSPVCPSPLRQHSTTEYLPGMIHTESPTGLLPKFPSWSLCCLGKSSLYAHTQGLDLPGFLSGSNFLLPWDITVHAEKDKWPAVGESGKKSKQKKSSRGKELTEVNLRVYIGEEYECPRGHRFFCSGPEKIIKVSNTSTVKDNANKLINLDMPLYCPCHCRSSKGYMAQMMRVYIVTPEGPLRVSVNPLIQPAPHPCPIFHPGTGEEIDLTPGAIWILRLPSIFMGDNGVYTMPTDATHLPACRLLKGTFNFRETSGES